MSGKIKVNGEIVKDYLRRFPDSPSLTLAKKIYSENNLSFTSQESCRDLIRYYRGQKGAKDRLEVADKSFFKAEGSRNPLENYPESFAAKYNPYEITDKKLLILNDLHIPYQINECIKASFDYGKKMDVDSILINGDLIDFCQISSHVKDWRHRDTLTEFQNVIKFLELLRKNFPNQKIIYKLGNHCERWEKWLFLKAPEIFNDPYFTLEARLGLEKFGITIVKDKRPIHHGKLGIFHGHEFQGGATDPAKSMFDKTVSDTAVGHFHKTKNFLKQVRNSKPIRCWSMGCMSGLHPHFMTEANQWNLGWGYSELDTNGIDYNFDNIYFETK